MAQGLSRWPAGPRLALRPFELSDATAAQRIYGDARVMRWVADGVPLGLEQTEALLRGYIEHQHRHGFSFWAVIERATGELIGDAGLFTRDDQVEVGYTLSSEHWGRGYGTEAAGLFVTHAFETLGLPELIALVRPENRASARILEKLGFAPAGTVAAYGAPHDLYRRGP